MKFEGVLFTYYEPKSLTAFESGPLDSPNTCIFVAGLTEGYNAVPFLPPLQSKLADIGWSLVQVQLTSSYNGFGTTNLQNDSDELDHLIKYLKNERNKSKILYLGHSTGSQDGYWHNKYGKMSESVMGYILQAPVSDRQVMEVEPEHAKYLEQAKKLREANLGQELMPRAACGDIPITADRFYSLGGAGGDDDVFSTDLTDETIKRLYEGVNRPTAMVHVKDDECYVGKEDQLELMKRFQSFCPAIRRTIVLEEGGHNVNAKVGQEQLCDFVVEFIRHIS
ncbi:hypothetical protein BDB00DRAFT_142925 [Zychaea mexicana]|uniref:uncharacterized protein n=1 Tax=Zychaea mexicana TaxID=64656 RepID=UPI0022FF08B5|nr:uncharacterized protein BDB00DRAFT_142925 [Zychaea mexicana]KAI9496326.1 hypothetical protein BDB00DRAFT_142925 [Zychaea mexicana]